MLDKIKARKMKIFSSQKNVMHEQPSGTVSIEIPTTHAGTGSSTENPLCINERSETI